MEVTFSLVLKGAGWAGAIGVLVAYVLVSRRHLAPDSKRFQGANALGSLFIGANAALDGAWPSAVLNGTWIVIGLAAIAQALRTNRSSPPAGLGQAEAVENAADEPHASHSSCDADAGRPIFRPTGAEITA